MTAPTTPFVGLTVQYALSTADATEVNRLHSPGYGGFGNTMVAGQLLPGTVVSVNDADTGSVNMVCFVDGNYVWWATSRLPGDVTTSPWGVWRALPITQSPPTSG